MDTKVAENIKKPREERSLTREAAEALAVSALTVYKWEAARLPIEYKMIRKIAEFYDIPSDEITGDKEEEEIRPSTVMKIVSILSSVSLILLIVHSILVYTKVLVLP